MFATTATTAAVAAAAADADVAAAAAAEQDDERLRGPHPRRVEHARLPRRLPRARRQ